MAMRKVYGNCDDCGSRPWCAISTVTGRRRCGWCWFEYYFNRVRGQATIVHGPPLPADFSGANLIQADARMCRRNMAIITSSAALKSQMVRDFEPIHPAARDPEW